MLFKNLVFHRLPANWEFSAADFETQLAGRTLKPCGPFDMSSRGWVPVTSGGRLLHTVNRQHMVALGVDEKLLPGSIVRQVAQERADIQSGWFAVDAASIPRAEMVVETLSDTLGTFAPRAVETGRSPQASMASWLLRAEAPVRFSIDDDLELQSADKAKSIIRYTRHPLDGKEIRGHLAAGKYPTRLGLTWNDRVSFVLTDKLQVKRLEFLEMSKDDTEGDDADPAEQFDIDFAVMAGELGGLLKDLTSALGSDASDRTEWPSRSKVA